MTIEQKEMLYELAQWHNKEFYNRMIDHWDFKDYTFSMRCAENIKRLEDDYQRLYGELPQWKSINDVWDTIKELEPEFKKQNN